MQKEKDSLVLIGDIHGEFRRMNYDIHKRYGHVDSHIIQVGDAGLGFNKPNYYKTELGILNTSLEESNNMLYMISGNHDDPFYFQESNHPFGYKNIKLLANYSTLNILGKKILLVGGAISIDRTDRVVGISYWQDEKFCFLPDFPYEKDYDIVVTHSRPSECGSFISQERLQYWFDKDSTLKNELRVEGEELNKLYRATKPREWYYGHMHASDFRQYENTTFRCLNINEHYMLPL